MAVPIAVLVFFASFVPIVGAVSTGVIAVAIAMVTQGPGTALAMVIVILVVQQLESNFLHPFLMSSAVSLHPVAVLLAVAAGGYLAGIVGAVFAVPMLAFCNTTVLYLKGYDKYLRLRYDRDRPGGAPGTLAEEMAEAARPDAANLASALKAREIARDNGTFEAAEASRVAAGKTQKEVQDQLAEFDDGGESAGLPSSAKPLPHEADEAIQGARHAEEPSRSPRDVEED
ncbi:AI-2E family transporter [Nanchangia anserum]|nr:AI-2E family transporter [Nanchangia anserum]